MPPRFIARQLSRPSGFFAPVIGALMNRHNARLNAFALDQLAPAAADRVLEIGFGGVTMPKLVATAGFAAGVDRSADVIRAARVKYATAVKAGRADFHEGVVERLPLGTAAFNKVLTVNTVYFWSSLAAGFAEIARVLAPGGRAVIGFAPKAWMETQNFPADIFTPRAPEEVVGALSRSGFRDVHVEGPTDGPAWLVAVATRS
jgi:SAM-dependent methyltransferase